MLSSKVNQNAGRRFAGIAATKATVANAATRRTQPFLEQQRALSRLQPHTHSIAELIAARYFSPFNGKRGRF